MGKNLVQDEERLKLGNKVVGITIVLNVILTVAKIIAGYLGNSTATIADGLHSGSDIITSVGVIIGMVIAARPHDEKHQYGHEKAESLAAFLLAVILTITGIRIGYGAIVMLFNKTYEIPQLYTAAIAFISIVVKEYQYRIAASAARKLNSNALMGDAWHHRSDALSSVAVFIGIIGARLGFPFLDPLAGTVVSAIVVKVGVELLIATIDELMDSAIDREHMEKILEDIAKIEGMEEVIELRGRKHGSKAFVDVTISVDPFISVYKGHDIGEKVERVVKNHIENIKDVIVHVDPCHKKLKQKK